MTRSQRLISVPPSPIVALRHDDQRPAPAMDDEAAIVGHVAFRIGDRLSCTDRIFHGRRQVSDVLPRRGTGSNPAVNLADGAAERSDLGEPQSVVSPSPVAGESDNDVARPSPPISPGPRLRTAASITDTLHRCGRQISLSPEQDLRLAPLAATRRHHAAASRLQPSVTTAAGVDRQHDLAAFSR